MYGEFSDINYLSHIPLRVNSVHKLSTQEVEVLMQALIIMSTRGYFSIPLDKFG